ncbi:MAG TPA: hypothetical protein ENI56_02335 [Candidatus Kaiserbacteria bacterium]|nr:hypothetical protein [Candidatus Kaiserbacteria bacterium]
MNQRLIIILELLVAFGLYFWYVQPTYVGNIQALHTKITSEHVVAKTMKKYSQEEARLEEKQNNISQSDISRLSKMLPATNGTAHFLLNINALALRSGFTLSKFDIKDQSNNSQQNTVGKKQKLYDTFVLGISGKGTYGSFRQFLDGLERSLRLVDVTSLSIKANISAPVAGLKKQNISSYDYSLILQIYRLSPVL